MAFLSVLNSSFHLSINWLPTGPFSCHTFLLFTLISCRSVSSLMILSSGDPRHYVSKKNRNETLDQWMKRYLRKHIAQWTRRGLCRMNLREVFLSLSFIACIYQAPYALSEQSSSCVCGPRRFSSSAKRSAWFGRCHVSRCSGCRKEVISTITIRVINSLWLDKHSRFLRMMVFSNWQYACSRPWTGVDEGKNLFA